jgi:hypothetical protein
MDFHEPADSRLDAWFKYGAREGNGRAAADSRTLGGMREPLFRDTRLPAEWDTPKRRKQPTALRTRARHVVAAPAPVPHNWLGADDIDAYVFGMMYRWKLQ